MKSSACIFCVFAVLFSSAFSAPVHAGDAGRIHVRTRRPYNAARVYAYYLRSSYLRHHVIHTGPDRAAQRVRLQRMLEAAYYLERVLETTPHVPYVWWDSIALNTALGRIPQVITGYEHISRLMPSHAAFVTLGALYELQGDTTRAIDSFYKAMAQKPDDYATRERIVDAYIYKGLQAQKSDDADNAHIYFQYAQNELMLIQRATNSVEMLMKSAVLLELMDDLAEAASVYRQIIACDPSVSHSYLRLAHILYEQGDRAMRQGNDEDARHLFHEAAQTLITGKQGDLPTPDLLNFAAYALARAGKDLDIAEKYVLRALDEDEDNGAYIDTLGWVFFKQGRLDDALEQILRAYDIEGDDPIIIDHLADIYYAMGNREKARQMWKKSLALDAENERVRQKLDRVMSDMEATCP